MRNKLKQILRLTKPQILVLGFFCLILLGAMLLCLPISTKSGNSIAFVDALFTATTSVCVTGLVIADTFTTWSIFGQLVVLFLIQVGGLGFMTLATLFSLAMRRKIGFNERILISESLGNSEFQGMVRLTKHILIGTMLFEGAGALILAVKFIPQFGFGNGLYKAIFHAVSAFCNAGIDLMGEITPYTSLTTYTGDWIINITIMLLIIIGGLGFIVWEDVYRSKRMRDLSLHTKLVLTMTTILIVSGAIVIFALEFTNVKTLGNETASAKVAASFFQSVTTRTAGFNTLNLPDLRNSTVLIMIVMMFIGAAPGSTGGGIKVTTVGILIASVLSSIRGKDDVNIYKKRISWSVVNRSFALVLLALTAVIIATLIVCTFDDVSIRESLFECVSAFATVGLSFGITPSLCTVSKITLICLMFLGRVGILTIALSIAAKSNRNKTNMKYPEGRIII